MNKIKKTTFFIVFCVLIGANSHAQFPNPRFDGIVDTNFTKTITGTGDQTTTLQGYIDEVSANANGGVINITPSGTGVVELETIYLKSNVHIRISKNTIFKPIITNPSKNFNLFDLTSKRLMDPGIENVQISCFDCDKTLKPGKADRYYTIDFSSEATGQSVKAFAIEKVKNFRVADFYIDDNFTKLSAVSLNARFEGDFNENDPATTTIQARPEVPTKGMVENGYITGASYGYGLVQAQVAQDVSFKDLYAVGGVTLRFESGGFSTYVGTQNQTNLVRIDGVEAFDITSKNGKTALGLAPHGRVHGSVHVKKILAIGSAFAVKSSKGFIDEEVKMPRPTPSDPKPTQVNSNPGRFKRGIFQNVILEKIKGKYKANKAQIKIKDYYYYPVNYQSANDFDTIGIDGANTADPKSRLNVPSIIPFRYLSIDNAGEIVNTTGATDPIYNEDNEGDGKYNITVVGNVAGKDYPTCIGTQILYATDKNNVCSGSIPVANAVGDFFEEDGSFNYGMSPNPASDSVSVNCPTNSHIAIYDSIGNLVKQLNANSDNPTIDISGLNTGIYFVRINNGSESFAKKLWVK